MKTTHSPVESAVAPLRDLAVKVAEEFARQRIARVHQLLSENDWDLEKVAPYPSSNLSRPQYMAQKRAWEFIRSITKSALEFSRGPRDPDPRTPNPEAEARFIEMVKKGAAASYEAYAAKLVAKLGTDVQDATLRGSDVWYCSFLDITRTDGSRETWKTQQIWNHSVLGLEFPQWPTRKMK